MVDKSPKSTSFHFFENIIYTWGLVVHPIYKNNLLEPNGSSTKPQFSPTLVINLVKELENDEETFLLPPLSCSIVKVLTFLTSKCERNYDRI
jgi:hypothetical protein